MGKVVRELHAVTLSRVNYSCAGTSCHECWSSEAKIIDGSGKVKVVQGSIKKNR